MLREEDILLQPHEDGKTVVLDRQFLGREYRYCLETGSGRRIHARTAVNTNLLVGARVNLSVTCEKLQIFPASSSTNQNDDTFKLSA